MPIVSMNQEDTVVDVVTDTPEMDTYVKLLEGMYH